MIAKNVGRDGESITTVPLAELTVDMVDMLTLVLVGASSTRQVEAGGQVFTYTPRGYEGKRKAAAFIVPPPMPSPARGRGDE